MSVTTTEIPKDTWKSYFNDIDKLYSGWQVTVEELAGELGDHPFADGLPLQGISFDPAGSQAGDILIEAGDKGQPFEIHLVHKPRAVRAAATQPGAEFDIEIESEEGVTSIVRLRPRPALPPGEAAERARQEK